MGGISLLLNSDNTIRRQIGWGTNENLLAEEGYVFDPPTYGYFNFGSGGGPSGFYNRPFYQYGLTNSGFTPYPPLFQISRGWLTRSPGPTSPSLSPLLFLKHLS